MAQFEKRSESVYCLKDSCLVYAVKQGESCILIDFGTGAALDALASIGVKTVEAILMTHHHRDQGEGLPRAAAAGIPIYVPETEVDLFARASELWHRREIRNNYNNRQDRFSLLDSVPVRRLPEYGTLTFAGLDLFVLPTPGHTVGSVSLVAELDGVLTAFTGDLIYAPGKVWSLAATQWSYNGGEGIPYTILSLLELERRGVRRFLPSHGEPMEAETAVAPTVDRLAALRTLRGQNPRLFLLRDTPYEPLTPHVLFNRTSMANSYVVLSESGKALFIDFGYDFMAGPAAGSDRSSRRPWLYTIPALERDFGVTKIDAVLPTHYHDDHVAGFNLLRRAYGARVLCPQSFAALLEKPEAYDLPCLWYDPIPVDERLPENEWITWEEHRFRLHPMPGHTRFAVAVELEADGQTIVFTGDQYAEEQLNYVYKNIWDPEDFIASAKLLRELHPDWILSGHWAKQKPDEDFFRRLMEKGEEVSRLHHALLPENDRPLNDFLARFTPYEKTVAPGEIFTVEAELLWKNGEGMIAEAIVPEGFALLSAGRNGAWVSFTLRAPETPVLRARLGCRVFRGECCLGTQAEMLITVEKGSVWEETK